MRLCTAAIVLAAGKSSRFKARVSKPLVTIAHWPMIIHSLWVLSRHSAVKEIIVVVNRANRKRLIEEIGAYRIAKIKTFILGGPRRQDSVVRGLSVVGKDAELVLIHDAARPFINNRLVDAVISTAQKTKAAILAVPVKATIKRVRRSGGQKVTSKYIVEKTLERKNLWEVQTPQVFARDLLEEAYQRFGQMKATDDAMLVEKLGVRVSVVRGAYDNIKITTAEDLIVAEAIAKEVSEKPHHAQMIADEKKQMGTDFRRYLC
jgi:2-C-methyl-D-erythritol 4-phosphate cytidylyltransferase